MTEEIRVMDGDIEWGGVFLIGLSPQKRVEKWTRAFLMSFLSLCILVKYVAENFNDVIREFPGLKRIGSYGLRFYYLSIYGDNLGKEF